MKNVDKNFEMVFKGNAMSADLVVAKLKDEGIESVVKISNTDALFKTSEDVDRVYVHIKELDHATKVLKD